MRLAFTAAFIFIGSLAAQSAELKVSKTMPFDFSVTSVEDVADGQSSMTVATIKMKNGGDRVSSVKFHCNAKNGGGYTWDVEGEARNVEPSEVRSVRLTSIPDNPEYTSKATSVKCRVASFDLGPIVD